MATDSLVGVDLLAWQGSEADRASRSFLVRWPSRRPHEFLASVVVLATLVSCSTGGSVDLATIEGAVPDVSVGELYVSTSIDDSCRTDCPRPGLSRGWVIDCTSIESARSEYVDRLVDAGFKAGDDGTFTTKVDGVEIALTVSTYDDASVGPQPTEEPYVSDPASLADRCSLFVAAVA